MKKRKIIAVSGARSEYDLMFSIYEKLNQREDIEFSIVITGPHLSEKYGITADYIEKDNFAISDKIYNLIDSDQKLARIASIGNQIPLLVQTLSREKPDIVLVAGDREEAISVTMTCAYMDVAVAHFFGGDIAKDGNIDNSVRYAASKFAHLHFTTLAQHKENLLRLGEEDWRINVIGNPALDKFLKIDVLSRRELLTHFNLDVEKKYCVLIQHSIITEADEQRLRILETLDAIVESGHFCFINYPNSDAGSAEIIKAYDEYLLKYPKQFMLFKNLDRLYYVNLLRNAAFLIGNSSSGLLEAPSFGLAAINVGSRQRGRVHGDNVIFVDNKKEEIQQAISFLLGDDDFKIKLNKKWNPYGEGNSSDKAVEVLCNIKINKELIYKNITY
jgi:GDP/UDP-N,N'-diacetylbacillosamine 2-epimerase (hydrolysing)